MLFLVMAITFHHSLDYGIQVKLFTFQQIVVFSGKHQDIAVEVGGVKLGAQAVMPQE